MLLRGSRPDTGHDERTGARRLAQAELQRRVGAHAQADDVRLLDAQRVEHRADVVGGMLVAVELIAFRHVGRRVAARVEPDAAVFARKPAHLLLPLAQVCAELVHEDDRVTGAGFLVPQARAAGICIGHGCLSAFCRTIDQTLS